jgi:hypothetical protein
MSEGVRDSNTHKASGPIATNPRPVTALPLSSEPIPFDYERIVYSGVECLITKEK